MKFPKRTASMIMITLASVLLTGCNDQPISVPSGQTTTPTTPTAANDTNQQQDDATKSSPAAKNQKPDTTLNPLQNAGMPLVAQFKDFVAKINAGDNSKYNFIMSADRLQGLQALNPPGENLSSLIATNMEKVNLQLKDSLVYSGYTTSGLHFIALVQPERKTDDVFKDAMNTIRGDQQEFQLLKDILLKTDWRSEDGGYYAVDLYAEDMLGHLQEIQVDDITIADSTGGREFDEKTGKVLGRQPIYPKDMLLNKVLQQNNRTLGDVHSLPNKSWNLFVFKAGHMVTKDHPLVIEYGGNHIYLVNNWLG